MSDCGDITVRINSSLKIYYFIDPTGCYHGTAKNHLAIDNKPYYKTTLLKKVSATMTLAQLRREYISCLEKNLRELLTSKKVNPKIIEAVAWYLRRQTEHLYFILCQPNTNTQLEKKENSHQNTFRQIPSNITKLNGYDRGYVYNKLTLSDENILDNSILILTTEENIQIEKVSSWFFSSRLITTIEGYENMDTTKAIDTYYDKEFKPIDGVASELKIVYDNFEYNKPSTIYHPLAISV